MSDANAPAAAMRGKFVLDNLSREDLEELENGLGWAEHEGGEKDEARNRALRDRLRRLYEGPTFPKTQAGVVAFLRECPGAQATAIHSATGCTSTVIYDAWRTGKVRREGTRKAYRYFVADEEVAPRG